MPLNTTYVSPTITAAYSNPARIIDIWEFAKEIDHAVLLGDPGGGKSTACHVLMHRHATDDQRLIPFLVTLREFGAKEPPERSVVEYIEHMLETFYQLPAPVGAVEQLLLAGKALLIFDGLDELLETSRRRDVSARIERFCAEFPLTRVLVTSRLIGYDQARLDDHQFSEYRLGGFTESQVKEFAHKWFAQESDARPGEADAFLSESESVRDLRSNPLLLSLMCILYRGEGSLPRNRAEVYQQCANLLFRRWDAQRRIHQDLRAGHLVEPALRHLAWWLFTREDAHSAVTERELISTTTEFFYGRGFESADEANNAAREFIEFCRGRIWVFAETGTTAAGEKLYSFTHRTFLEYFAASQLAFESDSPEELARSLVLNIDDSKWETVAEISINIKASTSINGAQRVIAALLDNGDHGTEEERIKIINFARKCAATVDLPLSIMQRLA
jgi:predicted NACHT family NTPase